MSEKIEIFVQDKEQYEEAAQKAEKVKMLILSETQDIQEIAGILNILVESFEKSFNCKLIWGKTEDEN